MTRTPLLITLAAAAALAGCNNSDHTIVAGPHIDDSDSNADNGPVALPPSIMGSKAYRCKNNQLIYIDWMSDGSARVKKTREEIGTPVTPGNELKGNPSGKTISYNGQSCNA
jgi:hypothetical protein